MRLPLPPPAWRSPARAARDFSGSTGEPVTAGGTVTIKLNNYWLGTFLGAWLRPGALSMPLVARSDHVGDAT